MSKKYNKLTRIYFSATGTTEKIISSITKGMNIEEIQSINLTHKKNRQNFNYEASKDEILIIGLPVYAAQIPDFIVPILKQLEGTGQPAILISVYGNVDEGLALEQMQSLLETKFSIIAAASFVGEHSYSKEDFKIGHN